MKRRTRLTVLLSLLALSLWALFERDAVRNYLYADPVDAAQMLSRAAPELPALESLDGPPVQLAALRGRVVLLHFWTFG